MYDRLIISVRSTCGIAEYQYRDIAGNGYDTSQSIRLNDEDAADIRAILERAKHRAIQAAIAARVEDARALLARDAPHLLAFKPEGIDHG